MLSEPETKSPEATVTSLERRERDLERVLLIQSSALCFWEGFFFFF